MDGEKLFSVLRHVGFGETMFKWNGKIYADPTAQVNANWGSLRPLSYY